MNSDLPSTGASSAGVRAAYGARFTQHVFDLFEYGYRSIKTFDYTNTDEETISGDLCEAIDSVIETGAHSWMKSYHVINEHPVQQSSKHKSARTREGKSRPKIDIEFVSAEHLPRQRLSIEAKRLCNSKSQSAYLGAEGLQCFLTGQYASEQSEGCMLGYVQTDSISDWCEKLHKKMLNDGSLMSFRGSGTWKDHGIILDDNPIKISNHCRKTDGCNFLIYHAFMDFS